jgi:hypothetical protein
MPALTWIHIAGGVSALVCGAVAFAVRKGGAAHASAGTWFCVAMFVLGATASILSPLKTPPESPIGGIMVCYFVATAWLAARRRDGVARRAEKIACAIVLVIAAAMFLRGVQLALAPVAHAGPPGPFALLAIGGFCALAGLGDLRFILRGSLSRTQRLSRHLWRMAFAFFIATGSFFLGQQDVLPQALRGSPLLLVPAFAPFGLMLFWLVRVRFTERRKHASGPTPTPLPARLARQ